MSGPAPEASVARAWMITGACALAGGLLGWLLSVLAPGVYPVDGEGAAGGGGHVAPMIPLWLVAPFALLLISIALGPLLAPAWWHHHFQDVAFFLGALVGVYYLADFTHAGYHAGLSYGLYTLEHTGVEYAGFIALVGGLYVVSGNIALDVRGRGGPGLNVLILGAGAVLANLVGTTGASMLLIRPFMRVNHGRLRPLHIVFFIFIVSNCGGCLTPIGDPPLYLGFLKGVPFAWTLNELWLDWLIVVGALLAMFAAIDARLSRHAPLTEPVIDASGPRSLRGVGVEVRGMVGLVGLVLLVAGVFITPALKAWGGIDQPLIGPAFQMVVAVTCHWLSNPHYRASNHFTWFPLKEVGLLFLGIFLTMMPALGYLAQEGGRLGLSSPSAFYFLTGTLSAVLDNAPTYLNFLQLAMPGQELAPATIHPFIATPAGTLVLHAISTGAVFFGAMTYIGNGPNFMVKAIAEHAGVKMPSFFGYAARAAIFLLPVLVLNWWLRVG